MTSQQAAPTTDQIRDAWDRIAPGFDRVATPETMRFGQTIVERLDVGPGVRFLDVAAGSGALAVPAARRGAQVVATDLAPTMVERLAARAQAEGLSDLEARVMDGQALELDDDTFDVSASLNGVSLFPDLLAGLGELARVTRPGGRVALIAFGAMQRVEFITFFMAAMQTAVPDFTGLPTDPPPPPFQVADPDVLRARLEAVGLSGVGVETVTWDMHFASASHLWDLLTSSNPIGAQLTADLTDDQRTRVQQVLDGMLRERSGGTPDAVLHTEINIGVGTA